MVKLQKLVLRNFKSFKKADIPLSNGFTAIVGSNGSGKTNILDALLFSLGISSMKMLRVSKMDELVNTGAAENYAKVELTLKHDGKTYVVQRMINKQGKGIYRLDGKRKTRNEIASLLLELGIKPEGHNIVVQGDTTRVIEMSPLERRQIIDELAGLQEFDAKKEEALKELQKVDNKLRDAGIVMQERENYLEQLRRDKEAASEFGSLQDEAKKIKATLIFSELEAIERAERVSSEKLEAIAGEKEAIEKELEEGSEERASLKSKAEELNRRILGHRERAYATVGAQLEEAKTEKALQNERIESKKELLERNRERNASLEQRAHSLEVEIKAQKHKLKEIDASLPEIQKKAKQALQAKAELQVGAEQREKTLAELEAQRETLSSDLERLKEEMMQKNASLQSIVREGELKRQAMREASQAIQLLEPKISEREKKLMLLSQLREKHGNIGQALKKAELARDKDLQELKEAEAERKIASESIELLKKSVAACPVCDAELKKDRKAALAAKKESHLKRIMESERIFNQRNLDANARIQNLREALERENALSIETADMQELRGKLSENREKLAALKQWLFQNDSKQLHSETVALQQKIQAKKAFLEKQVEKVKLFQQNISLGKLQQANNAVAELEKEEGRLLHQRQSILSGIESHLQKQRQEALDEARKLGGESQSLSSEISSGERKVREIEAKVSSLESKLLEEERGAKRMVEEKEKVDQKILKLEDLAVQKRAKLKSTAQDENTLLVENGKAEVRLADLREEAQSFEGIERIQGMESKKLNARGKEIDKRVAELGAINMKAIESYNELEAEVLDVRKKVEKLDEERLAVVEMIEKIDVQRTNVFMQCFDALNRNFGKMFNILFSGEGLLELSNKENPLEAGLLIQAKHKGDSIRNIDSMSGGEKTMTALAFLFAIQVYEPAPFYVFDEADAALDKENSLKMAKIVKGISKQSQFIAITHNDPLVQEADQIIGVALNKQKSSVIGLKLREKFVNSEGS